VPFIEVKIEGSGQGQDHFRAKLARGVPRSSLIPSNADGTPKHTTALVWIAPQNDTEVDRGIKRISDEEARALAREMDPKVSTKGLEQRRDGINPASKR
jgi:hypothetical protein